VQELAARYAEDGLVVNLELEHDEGLDPQVAAAAYGIVGEALVNVSRHSGAGQCTVRTASTGGELTVLVSDAGRGIGSDARAGVGSRSMRERAEEQGGRLVIHSAPGAGTSVEAVLPLGVVSRA
jgi:signal transduction histidine kinase